MKKIVLLLAGGSGDRFGSNIPKQFVEVDGEPIIVHTLRKIENFNIDGIVIVCIKEWIGYLDELINKYSLKNILSVVSGGESGHKSIFLGLEEVKKYLPDNGIVIIHDSVRPLITKSCFDDVIEKALVHKAACASLKSTEGIVIKDDEYHGSKLGDRYNTVRVQTPQAYDFKMIYRIYNDSLKKNQEYSYADAACILNGIPIYFSLSFITNIKITTKSDVALFKALKKFNDSELEGNCF